MKLNDAILRNANLSHCVLTNADLTGALVVGASFAETTLNGFTKERLYSTASYKQHTLQGINLDGNNLAGWHFSGQNLTAAIIGTDDDDVPCTVLTNADFSDATLSGAGLGCSNLDGANLRSSNLSNADLSVASLANANLAGAKLQGASFAFASGVAFARFGSDTVYDQWTLFPAGFDPVVKGLTFKLSTAGDFDANDALNDSDLGLLATRIRIGYVYPGYWPEAAFDLNADGQVTLDDQRIWIKDLRHTWFGDANLDGAFNSADLVTLFQYGQYEDESDDNSTWSSGDWNADGDFTTSDLVVAFEDGGYEAGPRAGVAAVPEPTGIVLLMLSLCGFVRIRIVR